MDGTLAGISLDDAVLDADLSAIDSSLPQPAASVDAGEVEDLDAALEEALIQKDVLPEEWPHELVSTEKQGGEEEDEDEDEDEEDEEDEEELSEDSPEEIDEKDEEFVPERRSSRKSAAPKRVKVGAFNKHPYW